MPRQPNDGNNLSNSTNNVRFFSTSHSTLDRSIAEAEKKQVRKEVITKCERYQELLKDRQADKDKVEQLLKKDNFSSSAKKEQAVNLLNSLTAELENCQVELTNLIEAHPSLQPMFSNLKP